MSTITRINTTARWSDVVIHNGTAYLVEVPTTLEADLATQTQEVFAALTQQLHNCGSDLEHIVQATIYLRDIQELPIFNQLWEQWIPLGHAPVRACVQAQLAHPDFRVEIQLTAATKSV